MTDRRVAVWSGATAIVLLVLASALQLRTVAWDTNALPASLERFQSWRGWLMPGGMLRSALLFPLACLGAVIAGEGRGVRGRAAAALLVGAGVLSGLAGVTATIIGVPAEEFRPGAPGAHGVEVLADSLYWISESCITLSMLAIGLAAVLASAGASRAEMAAARASLILAVALAAVYMIAGPHRTNHPAYYPVVAGLVTAVGAWIGLHVRDRTGDAIEDDPGRAGQVPVARV
jgi:hypothetical protein